MPPVRSARIRRGVVFPHLPAVSRRLSVVVGRPAVPPPRGSGQVLSPPLAALSSRYVTPSPLVGRLPPGPTSAARSQVLRPVPPSGVRPVRNVFGHAPPPAVPAGRGQVLRPVRAAAFRPAADTVTGRPPPSVPPRGRAAVVPLPPWRTRTRLRAVSVLPPRPLRFGSGVVLPLACRPESVKRPVAGRPPVTAPVLGRGVCLRAVPDHLRGPLPLMYGTGRPVPVLGRGTVFPSLSHFRVVLAAILGAYRVPTRYGRAAVLLPPARGTASGRTIRPVTGGGSVVPAKGSGRVLPRPHPTPAVYGRPLALYGRGREPVARPAVRYLTPVIPYRVPPPDGPRRAEWLVPAREADFVVAGRVAEYLIPDRVADFIAGGAAYVAEFLVPDRVAEFLAGGAAYAAEFLIADRVLVPDRSAEWLAPDRVAEWLVPDRAAEWLMPQ